jgi:toxin ParE1/3/4
MSFKVFLTADAVGDLEEIYEYIAGYDAPQKAEKILARIERTLKRLSESPERGAYPKELLTLGIREYRQIFFKPYRVIYRIMGERVYVLLIVDGRRDMETLLQRRLLQA